jgi:hypothetical protein
MNQPHLQRLLRKIVLSFESSRPSQGRSSLPARIPLNHYKTNIVFEVIASREGTYVILN